MATMTVHWINALIGIAIGAYSLLWPKAAAEALGIGLLVPTATTDFRATYGGMTLACGFFFLLAALRIVDNRAGLWFSILFYAGLGLTRGLGIWLDGTPQIPMMFWFLAIELSFVVVSIVLLARGAR